MAGFEISQQFLTVASPGSQVIMDDIRIYDRAGPVTDIQRIMAGAPPVPAGRR